MLSSGSVNQECFSLHWSGGIGLLHKAGSVKEFSVFESAPQQFKKGVFIVSGPVAGKALIILKAILQSSSLEYVVVITNCHPTVHTWSLYPAKDWNTEDRTGFDQLEEQVLMWMGNVNFTAEIVFSGKKDDFLSRDCNKQHFINLISVELKKKWL